MTKNEKYQFVKQLTNTITRDVVEKIESGKIPENWDGLDLRLYLADRFDRATVKTTKARKKEYNNTVLINNL